MRRVLMKRAQPSAFCGQDGALMARRRPLGRGKARWRLHFADSADLVHQGFEDSPATPICVLLACQEANAAALLGDLRRAREAMNRAQETADGPVTPDSGLAAWSCPRPGKPSSPCP